MAIIKMNSMQRMPKFRIGEKVVLVNGMARAKEAVIQSIGGGAFISENHEPVYVISFLPSVNATVYEKDLVPSSEPKQAPC